MDAGTQTLGLAFVAFQSALPGGCIESGTVRIQTGANMRCEHCRWQLTLLHDNSDPLFFPSLGFIYPSVYLFLSQGHREKETKRNVDLSSTGWWLLWLQEVDTGSDTVTSASDLAHPEQPRPHRINDGQRPTFLTLSRPKQGWCRTHDRKGVKPLWATQPDSPTCCPLLSCSSFHCMGERSRNRVLFAY